MQMIPKSSSHVQTAKQRKELEIQNQFLLANIGKAIVVGIYGHTNKSACVNNIVLSNICLSLRSNEE